MLETRVKESKGANIRNKLWHKWSYFDNYDIHPSDQHIHVGIKSLDGTLQSWCTVVYAHNNINLRKKLWEDLEGIHNRYQGYWFIIGDYNNVLSIHDRIGGKNVKESEYIDLTDMMERVGLFEKESEGGSLHLE